MPDRPILTYFDPPPIPIRSMDWCAIRDGDEPPCRVGWGGTEQEAIRELEEMEDDSHD